MLNFNFVNCLSICIYVCMYDSMFIYFIISLFIPIHRDSYQKQQNHFEGLLK